MQHSPLGVEIVYRPFLAGGRSLDYCDRFDPAKLADMTDRIANILRSQGMVGPLNRESFQRLIKHRPPNCIPAGFTADFLLDNGLIESKPEPKVKKFTEKEPPKILGPLTREADDHDFGDGILGRGRKAGISTWWTLYDAATGERFFERELQGQLRAEAAVQQIIAQRSGSGLKDQFADDETNAEHAA